MHTYLWAIFTHYTDFSYQVIVLICDMNPVLVTPQKCRKAQGEQILMQGTKYLAYRETLLGNELQ